MPQPNCAKRLECVELAPAFRPPRALRQRQQAGRTPCASRGSSSTRTFAACEHIGVLGYPFDSTGPYRLWLSWFISPVDGMTGFASNCGHEKVSARDWKRLSSSSRSIPPTIDAGSHTTTPQVGVRSLIVRYSSIVYPSRVGIVRPRASRFCWLESIFSDTA